MDGTLVDTEPYWMAAETALVESFGGTWSHDDALQLVGNGLIDSAVILQGAGVDMEAEAIISVLTDGVQQALRTQGVPFRPGARELLQDLKTAGIPTGLVTMSLRRMALSVVELMEFDAFDIVVAGDDVINPSRTPSPTCTPPHFSTSTSLMRWSSRTRRRVSARASPPGPSPWVCRTSSLSTTSEPTSSGRPCRTALRLT